MRSFFPLALGATLLALVGCAPGTGSVGTIEGVSTVAEASVCADTNLDMRCSEGEPTTLTRIDGSFSLPLGPLNAAPLVLEVKDGVSASVFDRQLYDRSFPLVFSGTGRPSISVFSTLEHVTTGEGLLTREEARSKIAAAFGIPSPDLIFSDVIAAGGSAYEEIMEASYPDAYAKAMAADASPSAAVKAAADRVYSHAEDFSKYFERIDSHWLTTSPPPSSPPSLDQVAETHYRAVLLGPGTTFGNGLYVPAVKLATTSDDSDCVTPDFTTLQSACFNEWSFSFDMVEDINDVVNSVDTSLRVSASVLGIASAEGTLSWEDYYRSHSDSTHAILTAEMRRCKYDLTATMKPIWETKFGTNYNAFRAGCGDRFLSAQTTGGSFVAVFEKELTQEDKDKDFKLRLKAKLLGLTVFDHTWRDSAESSLSEFGMSARVVTDRDHVQVPWLTLSDVTSRLDAFSDRVHSDQCADSNGYLNCVYLSSFNLYDGTTSTPRDPSANIDLLSHNLYLFEQYGVDYERLRGMVDAIVANPDSYNIGANVDRFSKPNDWTVDKLSAYDTELTGDISNLRNKAATCRENLTSCSDTPADLGYKGWFELADALPSRKIHVPKDCQELSLYYGARFNGSYTVFFNRDVTRSYEVQCGDMASSAPRTYLPLPNYSALPDQPTSNYSSHGDADGTVTRTLFNALLLTDQTLGTDYKLFGALPLDARFVTSTIPATAADGSGLAGVYNCSQATVSSNLDLTGTPFLLPATLTDSLSTNASSTRVYWEAPDQRRLDLHLRGGSCAYLRPTPNAGQLPLLYSKP